MIPLIIPEFLVEQDGTYLNVKDLTDYSIGQYPSFTLTAFTQGFRAIIVENINTGLLKFYCNIGALPQVASSGDIVTDASLNITAANNKNFVYAIPITEEGEYNVSIVSVPYIDITGQNFDYTGFKTNDIGFNVDVTGTNWRFYSANKNYPLKVTPYSSSDWTALSTVSDDWHELLGNMVTAYVRVESALRTNYYDVGLNCELNCAQTTLTLTDDSTYFTNPLDTFGINAFNGLTLLNITDSLGNEIGSYKLSGINFNTVLSNIPSGLYLIEYINIPSALVSMSYRTGDVVYDPSSGNIFQCTQDGLLASLAGLTSPYWEQVVDYESLSEQFRKVYVIPVLCNEIACFTPNMYSVLCQNCSQCKFCQSRESKNLASVAIVISQLLDQDEKFKQSQQYADMFTSSQKILTTMCNCSPNALGTTGGQITVNITY